MNGPRRPGKTGAFPIPDSRFPIPDSRFPIPDSCYNPAGIGNQETPSFPDSATGRSGTRRDSESGSAGGRRRGHRAGPGGLSWCTLTGVLNAGRLAASPAALRRVHLESGALGLSDHDGDVKFPFAVELLHIPLKRAPGAGGSPGPAARQAPTNGARLPLAVARPCGRGLACASAVPGSGPPMWQPAWGPRAGPRAAPGACVPAPTAG